MRTYQEYELGNKAIPKMLSLALVGIIHTADQAGHIVRALEETDAGEFVDFLLKHSKSGRLPYIQEVKCSNCGSHNVFVERLPNYVKNCHVVACKDCKKERKTRSLACERTLVWKNGFGDLYKPELYFEHLAS